MVTLSALPVKPVNILFPGLGTVASTASFGALDHSDIFAPVDAKCSPCGCSVAVPFIEVRILGVAVVAVFSVWLFLVQKVKNNAGKMIIPSVMSTFLFLYKQ